MLLVPLGSIVAEARAAGVDRLWTLLDRPFVATLLWNTVSLAFVVTVLAALIGTVTAWLTERTDLPWRKVWAVLLITPIVIPDFVLTWTWVSIFPRVHGYWGAVLVMTLHLYPLVYLPMLAAFRAADPGQEEAARGLGLSRLAVWLRISVRQARTTLLGGCLLVCLALLGYFGSFEDLGYRTFTTAIYGELQINFSTAAASGLSLVLVAICLLVLFGEAMFRDGGRLQRAGALAQRAQTPLRLGKARPLAVAVVAAVVGVALGFPLVIVGYWLFAGGSSGLPAAVSLGSATAYTALYSACASLLAVIIALPVALLASRHQRRWTRSLERSSFIVLAVPGIVTALALVYLTTRMLSFLYQSPELLICAYAILFFPLALVAMTPAVARASPRLEEAGSALGKGPLSVRLRVTFPLLAPGLAAAFCFVFLEAATELTATLLLVPTGVQTLATQFWAYAEEGVSFGAAAPYAATMIALCALPAFLLGRWVDGRFLGGYRGGGSQGAAR